MNSTPEHRHECLMRCYIISLPKDQRTRFYLDVRDQHGEVFARDLHADVGEYRKNNQKREVSND